MSLSTFITERITKKELASRLGVTEQCVHRYLKPLNHLNDFLADYPLLKGQPKTRVGLTKYQVWVVERLIDLCKAGMSKDDCYEENSDNLVFNSELIDYFSKETYERETSNETVSTLATII